MTKTTSRLTWSEFLRVAKAIKADGDIMFYSTFVMGVFFALRQSDLLKITWRDILNEKGEVRRSFFIAEQKTKKKREITISNQGRAILTELLNKTNQRRLRKYVFGIHRDRPMSAKWINYNLKKYFNKYGVQYSGNISSHLMRKTFGRYYWEQNGSSEASLVKLQLLFGHADIRKTMRYLGIEREEIAAMYDVVGNIDGLEVDTKPPPEEELEEGEYVTKIEYY